MNFKLLGKSGLRVSELCFGTMTFGEEWGWGASKTESRKMFDLFAEAGGNFIDTANKYTNGTSEKYIGEFIASERERFVLATKYSLSMRDGDPNASGNHRKNMVQSLEASLKRLKTDYIDLYWVHVWDFMSPVEEVMRALDDLVRAGKVQYVGISDVPAWIVSWANVSADLRGWTPFVGLQIEYSLVERTVERELLPMAREFDMAVIPWSPLGGGVLTGKYNKSAKPDAKRHTDYRINDRNLKIAEQVSLISDQIGCSASQVAINWVRKQHGAIIPILGARTEKQLKDNLGCLEFELSEEHLKTLNEASKIDLGFPHEFISREATKNIIYGGMFEKIENNWKR
jgi:aryl-alcohol dehydrogenase-like predicted oxidoreductase